MSKLKLKLKLIEFFYQQKTYAYCVCSMIAIPLIHKFWQPLSFEFMLGMEIALGALILVRNALAKIHGHRHDRIIY